MIKRLQRALREPLIFKLRYLWAMSIWFRLSVVAGLVVFAMVLLGSPYFLQVIHPLDRLATQVDETTSTIVAVIIGALISTAVSLYLQRDQFKREGLIDKRERIYAPLYDDISSLVSQIGGSPFPRYITTRRRDPQLFSDPIASFHAWTEISQDERAILVPKWMNARLDEFVSMLVQYNEKYKHCQQAIGDRLLRDLRERGYLDEASGFSKLRYVLTGNYDADVGMLFSTMSFVSSNANEEFSRAKEKLIPELFREYARIECVLELKQLYFQRIVPDSQWLVSKLAKVIRFIERNYGSLDQNV